MVTCNSLFRSRKHVHSLFTLFFTVCAYATPLTFDYPSFGPAEANSTIIITGNASIPNLGIQLTPDPDANSQSSLYNTSGRATYFEPLHLWNETSGKLTDFATHFSFVIEKATNSDLGEGLAFFLAPNSSSIPPDATGGRLGLESQNSPEKYPFVAVEFDTYKNNEWEANLALNHIGILINSMSSVANVTWSTHFYAAREHEAWIRYDSGTKNLTVSFTSINDDGTIQRRNDLYYLVDLKNYLPQWVTFGFSAATGQVFETNNITSWNFTTSATVGTPGRGRRKVNTGLVVGLITGSLVLVGGLALFAFGLWKKVKEAKKDGETPVDKVLEKGGGPRKLSYRELARATKNFSEKNKLGEGGFGAVYRGFLTECNSMVAIKRVSRGSKQGITEYAAEVKIISRLRHRNLVQLKGWSHERRDLLLVYEFMANGSLDLHLFKENTVLTWIVRYKIVKGLAAALLYLHEEWEQCILHRDLKPSNVMLDSDFNAKLGDFGLAKLVDHEKNSPTTNLAGTMGYMAIEYVLTRKASKESDVYSFGIICLEIASGRKVTDFITHANGISMVEWVWNLYGKAKILEAADQKLCGGFEEQEMERLLVVGLWCAHPDYSLRPSIHQATLVLNFDSPPPILPLKMPLVPTRLGRPLPVNMSSSFSSSDCTTSTTTTSIGSPIQVDRTQTIQKRTAFSYAYDPGSSKSTAALPSSASVLYTI